MTKIFILSLLLCISTSQLSAQWNPYKDNLDPGSKMLSRGANFTYEKTKDGSYKYKMYYPETKVITKELTSKNKDFKVLDGHYVERYDNGYVVIEGNFKDDKKQGVWKDPHGHTGTYISGERQGKWQVYREGILREDMIYVDGKLNGNSLRYDSLGNVVDTLVYELDFLVSTTVDTTGIMEISPRFPGCEHLDLSEEEKNSCASEKMLQYVYGNLKYPRKSRQMQIQGKAIVQFVVDKEGYVTKIEVRNGVSKDIKKTLVKLIKQMPRWTPGEQNGKKVNVKYTLPVSFKLEG